MNEETFYKIKLDLVHNTINNFVHVMQYDDGVAYIRAEIYKDWQHVYPSEEFDSAELRLKKHDGAWIKCNSVEPYIPVAKPSYEKAKTDGVYYYYQNGNYILVTSSMTEQAYDALDPNLFYKNVGTIISLEHDYVKINVVEELTDIPGGCPAVIDLYSTDGHIQTAKFVLDVDRNPIQTGETVKNVPEDVSAKLSEMSKGIANTVKVTPQTLTDEEKAQARENIGVGVSDINIENGSGLKSLQGKIQEGKETFNTNIDGQVHTSGASGDYSVLFGGVGEASGKRATALGGYNVAEGDDALAVGEATKATGRGSTTEGGETSAFGDYSHAEGTETICAAVSAHVEGGSSVVGVNSKFGHAEGVNNTVTDFVPNQSTTPKPTENTQPNANAGTTAPTPENTKPNAGNTETPGISGIGDYSGFGAHAEGGYNIANGIYSHVEGYKNTALFPYAHAEGSHTYAKGRAAHSEGYFVEANHAGSHAEGAYTKTGKDYQHVSGLYNIGKENTLFEVGNGNASVRKNAFEVYSDGHAEVQTQGTTEKSIAQVKFVQDYVAEHGGANLNVENGSGEGSVQQKQDGNSGVFDFTNKNPNATALDSTLTGVIPYGATGNFAVSLCGKGQASGKRSFQTGTMTIAKGNHSFSSGDNSVALADDSFAGNYKTVAAGIASFSIGYETQAIGPVSFVAGTRNKVDGGNAAAFGSDILASHNNQFSIGYFNNNKIGTLFEVGNGVSDSNRSNAFEVYSDGHAEVKEQGTTDKSVTQVKFVKDTLNSYLPQIRLSSAQVIRPMSRVVHDTYTEHKITFQITAEQASYIEDNSKPVIKLQLSQHIPYIDGDYLYLQRNVIQTLAEREVIQFTFNNARFNFDEALTQGYVPMTEIGDGAAIYDKSTKTLFVSFVETSPKKVEDALSGGGGGSQLYLHILENEDGLAPCAVITFRRDSYLKGDLRTSSWGAAIADDSLAIKVSQYLNDAYTAPFEYGNFYNSFYCRFHADAGEIVACMTDGQDVDPYYAVTSDIVYKINDDGTVTAL